jgi:hypothetical protein
MSTPPLAPTGMASGPFGGPQAQQAAREVNTATLCRIGQETVQDIVYRTMEIFQLLRNMQVGAWGDRAGESGPPRATSGWPGRLYTPGPQRVSPCPERPQVWRSHLLLTPYLEDLRLAILLYTLGSQYVSVSRPGKPSGMDTPPYTQSPHRASISCSGLRRVDTPLCQCPQHESAI